MIKEKVIWAGQKYELEWFDLNSINLSQLKNVTQIYGFLFDEENRLCIVRPTEKRGWRLPGGGIEKGEDWKKALIREAGEEADIDLDKNSLKLIGCIKVTPISENCEKQVHYLLRAKGKIIKIKKQTQDIAESLINERKFIPLKDFLKFCPWGKIGEVLVERVESRKD